MRVGFGYDVHQLVPERDLILGGVTVPYEMGLLGHSDADVVVHAIIDALLGAAGLGDIGKHFPDTDMSFKDADSLKLLSYVKNLLLKHGWMIGNIDATIVAQRPKLEEFIPFMCENCAKVLEIENRAINIKATTTEHLGFEGRGEGISAYAVCMIAEK